MPHTHACVYTHLDSKQHPYSPRHSKAAGVAERCRYPPCRDTVNPLALSVAANPLPDTHPTLASPATNATTTAASCCSTIAATAASTTAAAACCLLPAAADSACSPGSVHSDRLPKRIQRCQQRAVEHRVERNVPADQQQPRTHVEPVPGLREALVCLCCCRLPLCVF